MSCGPDSYYIYNGLLNVHKNTVRWNYVSMQNSYTVDEIHSMIDSTKPFLVLLRSISRVCEIYNYGSNERINILRSLGAINLEAITFFYDPSVL